MKKFKTLFFSIFIVMLLVSVGCKSMQPTTQVVHDSVYVEKTKTVTVTDTVFKTEAAQVSISYPCDSFKQGLKPVSKTFKNATLKVERQGGQLKIDCACDTLSIKAQLRHTIETEYKARSQLQNIVTTKLIKYVPWYVKILAWCGGISLALILGFLSFKLFWV